MEICRLPKDATVGQILKRGAKKWGAEDDCAYFEQTVPIAVNLTQDIIPTTGNIVFLDPAGGRAAQGLISTDNSKKQKAFLILLGDVHNEYDGENALNVDNTKNKWQWQLNNSGTWLNFLQDGSMKDEDWRCKVQGATRSFVLMFDITADLTDVDGDIGIRLYQAESEQISLNVTANAYLTILWKL